MERTAWRIGHPPPFSESLPHVCSTWENPCLKSSSPPGKVEAADEDDLRLGSVIATAMSECLLHLKAARYTSAQQQACTGCLLLPSPNSQPVGKVKWPIPVCAGPSALAANPPLGSLLDLMPSAVRAQQPLPPAPRPSPCAMVLPVCSRASLAAWMCPRRLGSLRSGLIIKPLGLRWRTAGPLAAFPPPPRRTQRPVALGLRPHRLAFPRRFMTVVHGSTPRCLVDRTAREPATHVWCQTTCAPHRPTAVPDHSPAALD